MSILHLTCFRHLMIYSYSGSIHFMNIKNFEFCCVLDPWNVSVICICLNRLGIGFHLLFS